MNKKKKKPIQKEKQQIAQAIEIPNTAKIGKQQLLLLFCLLVLVFIAYLPALHKKFTNCDDDILITQNPYIANLSFSNISSIFSNFYQAQYSPVPTVIYGIIHIIVGFKPFLYNLIAVVLHLITITLVYKLIRSLCNNFRIAFVTAALFGIATMQVESVAWLSAVYKTCLYSIFFLSSLIVYVNYIKTQKKKYIILSLLLFIISCFCKEQAVALSLAIVAIDIFLGRKLLSKKVIIEKIPYLLISLVFGFVTIAATMSFHQDVINITSYSIIDRVIYACYSLCVYIFKLFIPFKLALNYPFFQLDKSRLLYMIFPLLLLIISVLYGYAIKKKNKYIIFGGLFFLLNILFSIVLQVIAVRPSVMADRYVYLASIGIFFIVAKGADIIIEKKLVKLPVMVVLFVVFFLITANLTYSRTKVWRNSMTLWNDEISKYQTVKYAYNNRGLIFMNEKKYKKALDDFNKAIELDLNFSNAYNNRATAKANMGDKSGALDDYNKAIAISPNYADAYNNRGNVKRDRRDFQGAIEDCNKAIAIDPNNAEAYNNRGNVKRDKGDFQGAIKDYENAIAIRPNLAIAYNNKGGVMGLTGDFKEAIINFNKAIEINPNYADAYYNRASAKYDLKDFTGTIEDCEKVLKLNPNNKNAQTLIANAQQQLQKISK